MTKTPEGAVGIEVVVERDGRVRIYATDPAGAPIPPNQIEGAVICERGPVRTSVAVMAKRGSDAAEARCSILESQDTMVTYDLRVRGAVLVSTLRVPPAGTAGMAAKSR